MDNTIGIQQRVNYGSIILSPDRSKDRDMLRLAKEMEKRQGEMELCMVDSHTWRLVPKGRSRFTAAERRKVLKEIKKQIKNNE